jgi:hypothetical protein
VRVRSFGRRLVIVLSHVYSSFAAEDAEDAEAAVLPLDGPSPWRSRTE